MDNKVVTTIGRALRDTGIPTLRFNFRGVGASAGTFDRGIGETADADAAASWGAGRWPGRSLVIAGFSFGGYVAWRLALQRAARCLITVAPAIQLIRGIAQCAAMSLVHCPGRRDDVVDPAAVSARVNALNPKPRLVLLPGVGHFFHGRLQELRDAVSDAVRSG